MSADHHLSAEHRVTAKNLIPADDVGFSRTQRVSLLLEATALSRGLNTLRIATRGFTAGHPPGVAEFGFQHTLSTETSRAAVRACDDRLMRQTALTEAEVSVPPSRCFGYMDADTAIEYSQRFRRGVLIKPRSVEVGPIRRTALTTSDEIQAAIDAWQQVTGDHATYLVERRMTGREYTAYVVGNHVVSVARVRGNSWVEEIYRAGPGGFGQIHPAVLSLALRAFHALPAMPHGEVRIMSPGQEPDPDRCVVVSIRPEIGLLRRNQPTDFSVTLAEHLISHASRNLPGLVPNPPATIAAAFSMNEVSEPHKPADQIQQWIGTHRLTGEVQPGDREIIGTLTATPGQAVTLSGLAKNGVFTTTPPQTITWQAHPHPRRQA